MYRILLICLGSIVQGDVRIDIGDIPYENQDRKSGVIGSTTDRDYGDIPYDKGIEKHRDYGNVPYERVFSKPHIEDYGHIPYENDLDIPAGGSDEFDIKGKILEILGGREIPDILKTTRSDDHWATPPSRSTLLTKPSLSDWLSTIRMRAVNTDAATAEYEVPNTIDDSDCSDTDKKNCSHCTDTEGYRRYCLNGSTTPAPSDMNLLIRVLVNLTSDYEDYNSPRLLDSAAFNKSVYKKYPKGWPDCPTTTLTTPTPTPTVIAPNEKNGLTISKCYVCGLVTSGLSTGADEDRLCADSFMSHAFKKHCKFLDRDGWFYNGSQDFYMWGRFTGGCSMRFVDIAPLYTQRTCRDRRAPTVGGSYVSRRLARLEYALKNESDNCISSPEASLVPLSRGISLYSRMTVCVCSTDYCNRAEGGETVSVWHTMIAVGVLGISKAF